MAPPVPVPNTEVKRPSADDTEGATLCGKYATARGVFSNKPFLLIPSTSCKVLPNIIERVALIEEP